MFRGIDDNAFLELHFFIFLRFLSAYYFGVINLFRLYGMHLNHSHSVTVEGQVIILRFKKYSQVKKVNI